MIKPKLNHRISNPFLFLKLLKFKFYNRNKIRFRCPVCSYHGPLKDFPAKTGIRLHAICPKCGSMERHRLQKAVMDKLSSVHDFSKMKILHFAPETFFKEYFLKKGRRYFSIDLNMANVNLRADITILPFHDASFDLVFASHVLEHIKMDMTALSEIRRVLAPHGIAILPVPIIVENTIEYPEPNPYESNHVRAPGSDYFNKYKKHFSRIDQYSSADFPASYQTYIFEQRDCMPTTQIPFRKSMAGIKHIDIVPVCYC